MTVIGSALVELGPCSTQKLAQYLIEQYSLSPEAARKRIQRARQAKELLTANFNLSHNQQFVYLKGQQGTKLLRTNLLKTIKSTNSALRLPLSGLAARGGLLPAELFATFSGLPISGREPTAQTALDVLLECGMVVRQPDTGCLQLDPLFLNLPLEQAKMNGRLSSEQIVLAVFSDWLKLQGLISKHFDLRGGSTQFGFHHWDLKAPCSKYPFALGYGEKKNLGYIVADVILGRQLTLLDVDYFFHKCEVIRRNRKMPYFFAWLIADRFEYDVIEKAQVHGVVCTTPRNLFGKQLASLALLLGELMEGKDFAVKKTEDIIYKIGEMLDQFDYLESTNGNLRGALFETMVGHWLSRQYTGTIRYGRLLKAKNGIAYDSEVLLDNPGTFLKAYECKNQRFVTLADVQHWFSNGVNGIRNHYVNDIKDRYPSEEYGIWTTGVFESDALAYLEKLKAECKKYNVTWCAGDETRDRIIGLNDPRMTRTYDSFLKPPLSIKLGKYEDNF